VLSWTKICLLPSMKSGKNDKSTTSRPTSLLQKNHLAGHCNSDLSYELVCVGVFRPPVIIEFEEFLSKFSIGV
jgi:hypothetical protein